jgi:signal transduction histidine kinase
MGFVSGSGEKGTISLIAPSPWFFYWHHERACRALGERVGFLIDHLRRAEHEATVRVVRAKVALVAQSSHRFGSLLGQLATMPEQIRNSSDEIEREEKIAGLAERITDARKEIESHIKLADRAMRLNIRPVRLQLLVDRTIKAARSKPVPDIEFHAEGSKDLTIATDDMLLRAAFLNLIDNSIDSMKSVKSRPKVLTITAHLGTDRSVEITFADTGNGMSQKKVDSLKQRLDGRTSIRGRTPGSGWGLPITSILLEALGAKIKDIVSKKNRGTSVVVTIPTDPQEDMYETQNHDSG